MLKIYLGDMEEAIYSPSAYFNNQYEDEWITAPLAREMILAVDRSVVVGAHLIESPVLGPIPPQTLSGGVKTLILMAYDDTHIYNASACGDNCARWILKIAEEKDLTINLHHIMDFGEEPFIAEIVNNGKRVHDMKEFVETAVLYV